MARKRKRLNKKLIATLSLIGMAVVVVGIYCALKYYYKDPWPYIDQARQLKEEAKRLDEQDRKQAAQEKDPEKSFELLQELMKANSLPKWGEAVTAYATAVENSRRDFSARILALTELGDMCYGYGNYKNATEAWREILKQDASNYEAKRNLAEFDYVRAQYLPPDLWSSAWGQVSEHADGLIRLKPKDSYGYVLKAHALLQLVKAGALSDKEMAWEEAEQHLEKALGIDPKDVLSHFLKAELCMARAEVSRTEGALEKAQEEAESYLRQAIEFNPDDPQAYLNLYEQFIFERIFTQKRTMRSSRTLAEYNTARSQLEAEIKKTIPELDLCIERFPKDGRFYVLKAQTLKQGDIEPSAYGTLIGLYEKALQSSELELYWYYYIAEAYRTRGEDEFGEAGQVDLDQSYRSLRQGLYHPDFLIKSMGPKANLYGQVRILLLQHLVDVSASLSRMNKEASQKQRYLATAKKAYQNFRDSLGEDVAPSKIAAGEIAFAAGNVTEAIKQFYQADQMLSAEGRPNARLKQKLFRVLKDTEQQAMAVRYAMQMWSLDRGHGREFVEYAEAVATIPDQRSLTQLLQQIELFEEQFGKDYRYRDRVQGIKAQVLLHLNRREEARTILEALPGTNDRLERLRAEAQEKVEDRIQALSRIVQSHPEDSAALQSLIGYYLQLGPKDKSYYQAAKDLVEKLLETDTGQNRRYLAQMKLILSESDPGTISTERRNEIIEQSIQAVEKGFELQIALGGHYQHLGQQAVIRDDLALAQQHWQKARKFYEAAAQMRPGSLESIRGQFDIAALTKNWSKAKQLINQLHQNNPVESVLYEGLLQIHQRQWEQAADRLEKYLNERPISRQGHTALAQTYQALGRLSDALEEAQLAWVHDMNNPNTQRLLMGLLHRRNQQTAHKVGWENLEPQRISDVINLINRLLRKDAKDQDAVSLQILYYPLWIRYQLNQLNASTQLTAEEKSDSFKRISQQQEIVEKVCQKLIEQDSQKAWNWIQWARVNYQYSEAIGDPQEKQKALQKTHQIYKQALEANPASADLAGAYAAFLRENGHLEETEKVLLGMIETTSGAEQFKVRIQLGRIYSDYPLTYPQAQEQFEQVLQEDAYHRGATMYLAELFAKQNKIDEAQQLYEKLRKHQNDPVLMSQEIYLLLNAGRLEEAEALVSEMEQVYPQQSEELLIRGNLEMHKANYAAAAAYADQILAKSPEEPVQINALLLKSKSLYFNRRFNEAEDALMQIRSLLPDSSNFGWLLLSNVYWAKGDTNSAVQELEAAWDKEPDSPEVQNALLQRLRQLRDWRRLEERYQELMKRYPKSMFVFYEAASTMQYQASEQFRLGEHLNAELSYRKALTRMEQAVSLSAQSGQHARPVTQALMNLYVEVGNFYRAQRRDALARKYYQSSLSLTDKITQPQQDDLDLLLVRAQALYGLGRKQESLQGFEKAILQAGDDLTRGIKVMKRATQVGTRDDIIAWAKRKLAEKPDWLIVHMLLADMYEEKGQVADQIRELETVRTLSKNQNILVMMDQILAASYIREKRIDKAIEAYQRLLELSPKNVDALNNLAYLLMDKPGREAEAVTLAERAYKLSPGSADIMDTYAVTLIRQNTLESYERSELILRRAIQQKQREGVRIPPGLYVHLGQALLGLGRHDEARSQLDFAESILQAGYVFDDVESLKAKIRETREKLEAVR